MVDLGRLGARLAIAGLLLASSAAGAAERCRTLEDLYGDTGNRFQGAIGFQTEQARTNPDARTGFGLAVDDVVIEWREFTLDEDTTDCATGGSCATVNIEQNNVFEGNAILDVVVTDTTPSPNDCDQDGAQDVPPTRDCNGNGIDDVALQVQWVGNPDAHAVEVVIADSVGRDAYAASFAVSSSHAVPGTVFVATSGNVSPTVRAQYFDFDDGTGNPCQNSVDAGAWGLVSHSVTVFLTAANLIVTRAVFEDDIDHDGWADNSETVRMQVEVANKTSTRFSEISLHLSTNDPKIECITRPYLQFGDLAGRETRLSSEAFELVMSADRRADALADFPATVTVSFEANEFQSPLVPQKVTFDVDLDATGGAGPTQFFEGFEGGFGQFTTMHLDETLNPPSGDILNHQLGVLAADGWRCQYSDPDWQGSASYNNSQGRVCYPSQDGVPDTYYWHVVTERGFSGQQSLHYGVFIDPAALYTTPRAQLEAIRTTEPVNLGWANVCSVSRTSFCAGEGDCPAGETCTPSAPLFTFKHQVSRLDSRSLGAVAGRAADRGIAGAQFASDVDGAPVGPWIRLEPFVNLYDAQANSNYFNCTFDPADDGNSEEDFFDPSDPLRSLGPSSMCAPNFNFVFQGSTVQFDATRLGKAEGPGFLGAKGPGTWVEPAFDLSRFRGRRMRLRYVATGLKAGSAPLWHPGFINNTAANPDPRDDGWFVDAVTVSDTLTVPASVTVEFTTNPDAVCGDPCALASSSLTVEPPASAAPGQVIRLDLGASTLDRCTGGVPQYQFWIDSDRDGAIDRGSDLLLRDWTQNPELLDTPFGDTTYLAAVRCATDATCIDVASAAVPVACPGDEALGTGSDNLPFLGREPRNWRQVVFADKTSLMWASSATVDFVRGDLNALRATGAFGGTGALCLLDDATDAAKLVDATVPAPGEGFYYLGRSASACNLAAGGSWDSSQRDAEIGDACTD